MLSQCLNCSLRPWDMRWTEVEQSCDVISDGITTTPFCWIWAEDWIGPHRCIGRWCQTLNKLMMQTNKDVQLRNCKVQQTQNWPSWGQELASVLLLLRDQISLDHLGGESIDQLQESDFHCGEANSWYRYQADLSAEKPNQVDKCKNFPKNYLGPSHLIFCCPLRLRLQVKRILQVLKSSDFCDFIGSDLLKSGGIPLVELRSVMSKEKSVDALGRPHVHHVEQVGDHEQARHDRHQEFVWWGTKKWQITIYLDPE